MKHGYREIPIDFIDIEMGKPYGNPWEFETLRPSISITSSSKYATYRKMALVISVVAFALRNQE